MNATALGRIGALFLMACSAPQSSAPPPSPPSPSQRMASALGEGFAIYGRFSPPALQQLDEQCRRLGLNDACLQALSAADALRDALLSHLSAAGGPFWDDHGLRDRYATYVLGRSEPNILKPESWAGLDPSQSWFVALDVLDPMASYPKLEAGLPVPFDDLPIALRARLVIPARDPRALAAGVERDLVAWPGNEHGEPLAWHVQPQTGFVIVDAVLAYGRWRYAFDTSKPWPSAKSLLQQEPTRAAFCADCTPARVAFGHESHPLALLVDVPKVARVAAMLTEINGALAIDNMSPDDVLPMTAMVHALVMKTMSMFDPHVLESRELTLQLRPHMSPPSGAEIILTSTLTQRGRQVFVPLTGDMVLPDQAHLPASARLLWRLPWRVDQATAPQWLATAMAEDGLNGAVRSYRDVGNPALVAAAASFVGSLRGLLLRGANPAVLDFPEVMMVQIGPRGSDWRLIGSMVVPAGEAVSELMAHLGPEVSYDSAPHPGGLLVRFADGMSLEQAFPSEAPAVVVKTSRVLEVGAEPGFLTSRFGENLPGHRMSMSMVVAHDHYRVRAVLGDPIQGSLELLAVPSFPAFVPSQEPCRVAQQLWGARTLHALATVASSMLVPMLQEGWNGRRTEGCPDDVEVSEGPVVSSGWLPPGFQLSTSTSQLIETLAPTVAINGQGLFLNGTPYADPNQVREAVRAMLAPPAWTQVDAALLPPEKTRVKFILSPESRSLSEDWPRSGFVVAPAPDLEAATLRAQMMQLAPAQTRHTLVVQDAAARRGEDASQRQELAELLSRHLQPQLLLPHLHQWRSVRVGLADTLDLADPQGEPAALAVEITPREIRLSMHQQKSKVVRHVQGHPDVAKAAETLVQYPPVRAMRLRAAPGVSVQSMIDVVDALREASDGEEQLDNVIWVP